MSAQTTTAASKGEIVSFMIEKEVSKAVRKKAAERMIPLSMWLREAAREKLKRDKKASAK